MRIVMIGTGYVGLVSGTCFAELGYDVTCIDKDRTKIHKLKSAEIPIFEPTLKELVERHLSNNRLIFETDLMPAVAGSDVIFIAVGTPTHPQDGRADLSYIEAVATEIAPLISSHKPYRRNFL